MARDSLVARDSYVSSPPASSRRPTLPWCPTPCPFAVAALAVAAAYGPTAPGSSSVRSSRASASA